MLNPQDITTITILALLANILSGVFTIPLFILALYSYRATRGRKSLSYITLQVKKIEKDSPYSKIDRDRSSVAQNPYVRIFQLVNDGNVPIRASDFDSELFISFGESVKIRGAEINEKNSTFPFKPAISLDGNQIEVQRMLWNPKDVVEFEVLLDAQKGEYDGKIYFTFRIENIISIHRGYNWKLNWATVLNNTSFGLFTALILGGITEFILLVVHFDYISQVFLTSTLTALWIVIALMNFTALALVLISQSQYWLARRNLPYRKILKQFR